MKPLLAALFLLGLRAAPAPGRASAPERAEGPAPSVVAVELRGSVQPASLRYLRRALRAADERRAELVVIELDTPGGLLVSLRDMTTAITASATPVVVFVTPAGARAASAGFFLLLAADVAAMSPGTNAGAAHPIELGPGTKDEEVSTEKAVADVAALARALAAQRGRPVEPAESAVRESESWAAQEALALKLIDVVAADRAELLAALDGRAVTRWDGRREVLHTFGASVDEVRPSASERLLMLIATPELAYLLFMAGLLGLLIELLHPGAILPGVLGVLGLLLALYSFSVLPVSAAGVLLIALAIGLFIAEAFVTSYGLLAVAGLVSLVLGSVLLVDSPVPGGRLGIQLVLPTAAVMAAITLFLATRVAQARRRRPVTGEEGLVGRIGEVVAENKVFVHGELWSADAAEPLPRGARVRVVAVHGSRLEVQRA